MVHDNEDEFKEIEKAMMRRNITGISWFLDTNVIGDPKAIDLIRLHEMGWIYLETPDTVFNELLTNKNEEDKDRLLNLRAQFPMPMGPHVIGRSTLGFSVIGSDSDQQLIENTHLALWQGATFSEDLEVGLNTLGQFGKKSAKKARSRVGDTLIVQTTLRYGREALVTEDRGILEGATRVRERIGNFYALSISEATLRATAACQHRRKLKGLRNPHISGTEFPDWP